MGGVAQKGGGGGEQPAAGHGGGIAHPPLLPLRLPPPCSCCLQLEQGSLGASFNGLRYALSPYQLEEALMNGQYRGEVLTGSKLRQVRWQMLVRAIDERSLASIHSDPHDGATRPPCLYFSPIANDIREIATGATFVTYVCDQNSTVS
nr:unnamed protein product [Haemonchus contortus]